MKQRGKQASVEFKVAGLHFEEMKEMKTEDR